MRRPLRQGGVERLDRRREVEGAGSWITVVGELVADTSIGSVHGPQPLAERRLGLAEGQEVQTYGAVVEGVRSGAPRNLVTFGFTGVGGGTLPQLYVGEMGVRRLFVETGGVGLGAAKDALLLREG